jgi:hypothetical protein
MLGNVYWVQERVAGDIGLMVEAKIRWIKGCRELAD